MDALLGFSFVCIVIITANHYKTHENANSFAKLMLCLLAASIALIGILPLLGSFSSQPEIPVLDNRTAWVFSMIAILTSLFCFGLIFSRALRLFLQNSVLRTDYASRHYEANSLVHTTAIILMIFMIIFTTSNFMLGGGVQGLAESMQESSIGAGDLLLNMALYLTAAFLGIGLMLRRNLRQSLERLGIHLSFWENIKHLVIGLFVGLGVFCLQIAMAIIWQMLVSPETLAEQTAASQQIFSAFSGSIWLGVLVALTAGIGEELLFRGALQPIFGNLLVSLFFVLMHSQYTLTPASLIILVVSLVFGLLRQNYSTNAAIVAHFVYNFCPFLMIYLASQAGLSF